MQFRVRLSAGVSAAARAMLAAVLVALALGAFAATAAANGSSLYSGPGPRPGPAILYQPTAVAPELTNAGIWRASPILVSGSTAYLRRPWRARAARSGRSTRVG